MNTGDLGTFAILVLVVVVIALVARRVQVVQPPPGAKTPADHGAPGVTDSGNPQGDNFDRAAASSGHQGREP